MKDRLSDRIPSYVPWTYQAFLRARKVARQTMTRVQERAAARRPRDPSLEDGAAVWPSGDPAQLSNPPEALTKCARWYEDDLARPTIAAHVDRMVALKAELARRGLRWTNTAGNFLTRQYHPENERGKLWENAWTAHHAQVAPGQRVLDVGGASTLFSFYLASLGCVVEVLDNDWANCGTIFNARYVAHQMGWALSARDRDVSVALPFPDAHFDRVFSICVLEHLPSAVRQGLMRDIGRVLKPGGVAGFTVDYDAARPVLVTDKGLRFAYREKLERDVIRPSGLALYGRADWTDACSPESFLGALFLWKPSTP